MMQRNPRMVAGIYQLGQVITSGPSLTIHTAYNRNTGDVVGLYVIELPPTMDEGFAQNLLQPLERRRLVQSPHVVHVYDWGIDGERAYIATDPPRGITLRVFCRPPTRRPATSCCACPAWPSGCRS